MRSIGAHEATTHLYRLLDDAAAGATIAITKRGVPVAVLTPSAGAFMPGVRDTVAGLRAFRAGHPLREVTIRELIDDGRR